MGAALAAAGHVGFAMNLLSIIDAAARPGPYRDAKTGTMIAYNGEIYNYTELAKRWGVELRPGESDAQVALQAYMRMGPECLSLFDGMFALAIYDPVRQHIFLARDRFGEKPLYYMLSESRLIFASEVKALAVVEPLAPRFTPEWLSLECPVASETPYEGVQLLEAGHYLILDLASWSIEKRCWWSIEASRRRVPDDPRAVRDEFSSLLRRAAELRRGDASALMLSGGLDSAVLAFLLRPSVLLTVRYPGTSRYDESDLAWQVARSIGSDLVCIEPTESDFRDHVMQIVEDLDYPMGNASLFSERMLYRRAAEMGIRVVHGGIGPDEFLLGYVRHALALDGPSAITSPALSSYADLRKKFEVAATRRASAADRYYRLILRGPDPTSVTRLLVHQCFARARDLGQAVSLVDMATAFPPLLISSDKLASSHGIERRSPYLAHDWAELCFWLPLELKKQGSYTKRLLRDFARELGVPRDIWSQVDKRGFASPVPDWLRTTLASWCDEQLTYLYQQDAPWFAHLIGGQATSPSSRFDRSRFHALLISIWWQRQRETLPPAPASLPTA